MIDVRELNAGDMPKLVDYMREIVVSLIAHKQCADGRTRSARKAVEGLDAATNVLKTLEDLEAILPPSDEHPQADVVEMHPRGA